MNTPIELNRFAGEGEVVSRPVSASRPYYWSLRRELWENRSIYIAPLIVAAVVLFSSLVGVARLPKTMDAIAQAGAGQQHSRISMPFRMAPAPIMLASLLVGLFYSLDALYGERRDRSILFWKSLPVSDRTTVLAKASVPILVLPAIAYVLSAIAVAVLILFGTSVLLGNGINPARLWRAVEPFSQLVIMFYGLAVHAVWFAPIYCWLLLISGWARRSPLLWAVLPPVMVLALEAIIPGSNPFAALLKYRVMGGMAEGFVVTKQGPGAGVISGLEQLTPARFLAAPGLWLGLAFAALCLALAVRQRRKREPI